MCEATLAVLMLLARLSGPRSVSPDLEIIFKQDKSRISRFINKALGHLFRNFAYTFSLSLVVCTRAPLQRGHSCVRVAVRVDARCLVVPVPSPPCLCACLSYLSPPLSLLLLSLCVLCRHAPLQRGHSCVRVCGTCGCTLSCGACPFSSLPVCLPVLSIPSHWPLEWQRAWLFLHGSGGKTLEGHFGVGTFWDILGRFLAHFLDVFPCPRSPPQKQISPPTHTHPQPPPPHAPMTKTHPPTPHTHAHITPPVWCGVWACVCPLCVQPSFCWGARSPRCPPLPPCLSHPHTPTHPHTHPRPPWPRTRTHTPHSPCAPWNRVGARGSVCASSPPFRVGSFLVFLGSTVPRGRIHAQATTGHQPSAPLLPHWLCNAPRARVRGTPTTAWPALFLGGWRARPFFFWGVHAVLFGFWVARRAIARPLHPPPPHHPFSLIAHTLHTPSLGGSRLRAAARGPALLPPPPSPRF